MIEGLMETLLFLIYRRRNVDFEANICTFPYLLITVDVVVEIFQEILRNILSLTCGLPKVLSMAPIVPILQRWA